MSVKYPIYINDIALDIYGAEAVECKIGSSETTDKYMLPPGSIRPVSLDFKLRLRSVVLSLDFSSSDNDTRREAAINISNFTKLVQGSAVEISAPDGYLYHCVLDSISAPEEKAPWILRVEYSFSGFRHGPEVTENIVVTEDSTVDITVEGDYETEAKVKITTEATSITVMGITISSITNDVLIDAMNGVVTENGVNKFGDTDMTEFPKLQPGTNEIDISEAATVEISYLPILY